MTSCANSGCAGLMSTLVSVLECTDGTSSLLLDVQQEGSLRQVFRQERNQTPFTLAAQTDLAAVAPGCGE